MNTLVVPGDAAATAHNIAASAALWRLSVAGDLVVPLLAVPQLWIVYLLLKPVSKNLALLFVFLEIVSLSVESISKLFLLMVLPVLGNAGYASLFEPQQLYALAGMLLTAHNSCFNIALMFFGADCLVTGYLIFKSRYFPRLIGLLVQLAGISYLIGTFSTFFAPAFADLVTLPVQLVALIGEASFCLWLLVMGVNVTKWKERIAPGRK